MSMAMGTYEFLYDYGKVFFSLRYPVTGCVEYGRTTNILIHVSRRIQAYFCL